MDEIDLIMDDLMDEKKTNSRHFEIAQDPWFWCNSAHRLAAGAESIIQQQAPQEALYNAALTRTEDQLANLAAASPGESVGMYIQEDTPNFLPAALLYAFALENVLKGLMVGRNLVAPSPRKVPKDLRSHDVLALARRVGESLTPDEERVLQQLSHIGEWAGRYPVAASVDRLQKAGGWSSDVSRIDRQQLDIARDVFGRLVKQLETIGGKSARHRTGTMIRVG